MITVWKFPIVPNSKENKPWPMKVDAPLGATPLSVGLQGDTCVVWMQVDTEQKQRTAINLYSVGTGFGCLPDVPGLRYIGRIDQGPYVWHIFTDA